MNKSFTYQGKKPDNLSAVIKGWINGLSTKCVKLRDKVGLAAA